MSGNNFFWLCMAAAGYCLFAGMAGAAVEAAALYAARGGVM